MNTCAKCRFFNVVYEHHYAVGQCRRHAPVIGGELGITVWPKVEPEFWCGDFKLKPELEPCSACGKLVGEHPCCAPTTYDLICKECSDKFTAGTHPWQEEYPELKELQKGQH